MLGSYHGSPPPYDGPVSVPRIVQWFLEHDEQLRGPVWSLPEAVIEVQSRVLSLVRGAETEEEFQAVLDTLVQEVRVKASIYEDLPGDLDQRAQAFLELRIVEAVARILGWIYLQCFGREYPETDEPPARESVPGEVHAQVDYYDLLGVEPSATTEQIREAYMEQVRAYHAEGMGNPEFLALLRTAYNVLSDPGRRAAFDQKYIHLVGASGHIGTPAVASVPGGVPVRTKEPGSTDSAASPARTAVRPAVARDLWWRVLGVVTVVFLMVLASRVYNHPGTRSLAPDPTGAWADDVESVVLPLVPDHLPVAFVVPVEPLEWDDVPAVLLMVDPADLDAWFAELAGDPDSVRRLMRESGEAVSAMAPGPPVEIALGSLFYAPTLPGVSPFDRMEQVIAGDMTIAVLALASHDGTEAEMFLADFAGVPPESWWGRPNQLDADQFMWTNDGRAAVATGVIHNPTRYWYRLNEVILTAYDAGGNPVAERPAALSSTLLPPGGSVGYEAAFYNAVDRFRTMGPSYDAEPLKPGFPLDRAPLRLIAGGGRSGGAYEITGSVINPFDVPITVYLSIVLRDAAGMGINGTTREMYIAPGMSEKFQASFRDHIDWVDDYDIHVYWVPGG